MTTRVHKSFNFLTFCPCRSHCCHFHQRKNYFGKFPAHFLRHQSLQFCLVTHSRRGSCILGYLIGTCLGQTWHLHCPIVVYPCSIETENDTCFCCCRHCCCCFYCCCCCWYCC